MTDFDDVPLAGARRTFIVANSPSYLAEELAEDPGVNRIYREFDKKAILEALKRSLSLEIKTTDDEVRPYVYVTALAKFGDRETLGNLLELAGPKHPWLKPMIEFHLSRPRRMNSFIAGPLDPPRPLIVNNLSLSSRGGSK